MNALYIERGEREILLTALCIERAKQIAGLFDVNFLNVTQVVECEFAVRTRLPRGSDCAIGVGKENHSVGYSGFGRARENAPLQGGGLQFECELRVATHVGGNVGIA